MNGYIKLFRQFQNWGWYDDGNTMRVFLDILLNVNFKPSEYHGFNLEAGQGIFGRKAMAKRLKLSEQSVRTAIEHLKSTNEITIKSTNKFSIITVVNWELYQCCEDISNQQDKQENNQQSTNKQPTTNQQLTTEEERKKERTLRNIKYIVDYLNEKAGTQYRHTSKLTTKYISARLNDGFSIEDFEKVINNKCNEWLNSKWEKYLRPETLFGSKFESYLNQRQSVSDNKYADIMAERSK